MGSTSILNSVLSALGGSTGINVPLAVDAILYADRAPERQWQLQQAALASQTGAINQLQSESSALTDALSQLQTPNGVLSSVLATSSNPGLLTATAVSGTSAANHVVTINNLASTGSWYSDTETSSSTTLPTGSFSITAKGVTTSIAIGSGVNTLDQLASYINTQSLGVTANVITDSSGARLSIVSDTSGSAGDISVANGSTVNFTRAVTGTDASLTVDGISITSPSNTVSGAISGVTLNLLGASSGTQINVSVAADTTSISAAINSFVSDYNTLITDVNSQISYNKATNTPGALENDSAISGLQSQLLAATNYLASSGSDTTLNSLGISTNSDGTLTVDSATLTSAIQSNSSAVMQFFQGTAANGFAASLTSTLNTYTDPTQGSFTVDLKSISSENQDLTDQTNMLEVYLASQQTILTAQYNAADIAIQQLPQQLKQIQALLNPNSSTSGG